MIRRIAAKVMTSAATRSRGPLSFSYQTRPLVVAAVCNNCVDASDVILHHSNHSGPTKINVKDQSMAATGFTVLQIKTRQFGRKASKMGHHLETKREKNKHKKHTEESDGGGGGSEASEKAHGPSFDDVDLYIEEDATETTFDHGSEDGVPSLPDSDDVKARMMKVVTAMEESFRAIRGAEPTPELFEPILVRAYGELTPLSSVAQVVITSPNQATLTCYDPETANAVRDGVRDSGLNFNPRVDEGVVIVPIPKVSMETRKTLAKQLGKTAEVSRQRVRKIRRAAQDVVKKGKDGRLEGVSKDDAFRVGKIIDGVTEETISVLNEKVQQKQDSIMAV